MEPVFPESAVTSEIIVRFHNGDERSHKFHRPVLLGGPEYVAAWNLLTQGNAHWDGFVTAVWYE